ncbi:MAG: fibronectin type III domain-containing protein [Proteobacteria bacterium]|nr:fibronectin type III domain-containing protein [Pseudomonadota bacterium]
MKLIVAVLLLAVALAGCNSQDSSSGTGSNTSQPTSVGNGTATLSWEAPTTTTSGQELSNLSGYRIYYGLDQSNLSEVVSLDSVGIQTYVIDNLGTGTWYFAIKAVTAAGVESALSNVVSKTIG